MKRFLLLLTLVLVSLGVKGQTGFSFGPKIGINVSDITSDEYSARVGMNVGVFAEYRFNNYWALHPEVLYSMQGAKTTMMLDGHNYTYKIDYITVPILTKLYATKGLSFALGPQVGFRAKVDKSNGGKNDRDLKESVNLLQFDAVAGVAYDFPFGIVLDVRYMVGMKRVFVESDCRGNNSVFQFSVGYKF